MAKCKKWHKGKVICLGKLVKGGALCAPFFNFLKTEKMKLEIFLDDQIDELMDLLDSAQNQISDQKYIDAQQTLHSIYEILSIYEF